MKTKTTREKWILTLIALLISGAMTFSNYNVTSASPTFQEIWQHHREGEFPTLTVGGSHNIYRAGASGSRVHSMGYDDVHFVWPAQAASATYDINVPASTESMKLTIRYSKNSPAVVPLNIFWDAEAQPRAVLNLENQSSWTQYTTATIDLGSITGGPSRLTLKVAGQKYGVVEVDYFRLEAELSPPTQPWQQTFEGESSESCQTIIRSGASDKLVCGQIGVENSPPWLGKPATITYQDIETFSALNLQLQIRYSKHSASQTPVYVYLDGELCGQFTPASTGSWTNYSTATIDLGPIDGGLSNLELRTSGQRFGVLEIDTLTLLGNID